MRMPSGAPTCEQVTATLTSCLLFLPTFHFPLYPFPPLSFILAFLFSKSSTGSNLQMGEGQAAGMCE